MAVAKFTEEFFPFQNKFSKQRRERMLREEVHKNSGIKKKIKITKFTKLERGSFYKYKKM